MERRGGGGGGGSTGVADDGRRGGGGGGGVGGVIALILGVQQIKLIIKERKRGINRERNIERQRDK